MQKARSYAVSLHKRITRLRCPLSLHRREAVSLTVRKKICEWINNKYSSIKINKTGDIIIFIDSYSFVDYQCNIIKITLYSSKYGRVLGSFEFNYDSYEILHDINVEIL